MLARRIARSCSWLQTNRVRLPRLLLRWLIILPVFILTGGTVGVLIGLLLVSLLLRLESELVTDFRYIYAAPRSTTWAPV